MSTSTKEIDCEIRLSNKHDEYYMCNLEGFILPDYPVSLNLIWQDPMLDPLSVTDRDFFECLIKIRTILLQRGLYTLCNGARKDVYPSGMQRDMGKAISAYQMRLGVRPRPGVDSVNIFDECSEDMVTTPDEQKDFFNQWTKSFGPSLPNQFNQN